MISGLYKVGSRLLFENERQEHIARNLAGSGLSGFKGSHLAASTFRQQTGDARQPAYGVDHAVPVVDFSQGALARTGRALDFAISGPGFFQVQTADGATLLTRNGAFTLAPDGTLVTQEGHALLGKDGPVRLDIADNPTKIEVAEDGRISIPAGDGKETRQVGALALAMVEEPDRLVHISANYFRPGEGQELGAPDGARVANGYLEQANVSPVREMAAMIQSLREFEAAQRVVKVINDLAQDENQKLS